MKFDIKDFYPSISEKLLEKALEFANKYKNVTKEEKTIIYNASKSNLVNQGDIWTKKDRNDSIELFDITMGSKHGAEISELVGLYILQGLKQINREQIMGIYRDYELIAMKKSTSNVEVEKIKNECISLLNQLKYNW